MTFPAGIQFIVQGASRGIGLAITKQILARDPNCSVIATCRGTPSRAGALAELQEQHKSRLNIISLDVESETSIESAASEARALVHKVDLSLIHI